MARFPSNEWVQEYAKKLNENQAYKDAGKTWEGAITFVVEKDETFPRDAFVYLGLYHGECRRALYADSLDQIPKAPYAYKGPYSNWRKLIENQIDPIQGLLAGKFRLDGSLMEIMKYIRAAKEMVATATTVQTEF
jgi:putative sterol carrier protein